MIKTADVGIVCLAMMLAFMSAAASCGSGPGGAGGTGGATTSSSTGTTTTGTSSSGGAGGMPNACDAGMACAATKDCPGETSACVVPTCSMGCCGTTNAPAGAACTDNGGRVCDGMGVCVACLAASDCPAQTTLCKIDACDATTHTCSVTNAAQGTACADGGGTLCDGQGTCVAVDCMDGILDGTETDVDCGGSCGPCADGKKCEIGADCIDGVCEQSTKTCAPASCTDGVQNGSETDVDCGGSACPKCPDQDHCAVNADCTSGFCQGTTCAPKPDGQGCTAGSQCASGSCVGPAGNQVCCDTPCNGTCQACVASLTGLATGTCGSILAGMPAPAGQCPQNPPCGNDGKCAAGGVCEQAPSGTTCGAGASCAGGQITSGGTCNGSGSCSAGSTMPCPGGLVCASASACKTACSGDGDCQGTTSYCSNPGPAGACLAKGGAGVPCSATDQCTSGICGTSGVGTRCCTATCSPIGGACGATDCNSAGACVFPPSGTLCGAASCSGGQLTGSTCDGSGSCVAGGATPCPGGFVCASATACKTACASDADCQGSSDYCKNPGPSGTCVPKGGPGAACTANDQCTAGTCGTSGTGTHCCAVSCSPVGGACGATDCDATGACVFPSGTSCGAASCNSGQITSGGTCNGAGSCGGGTTTPCPGGFVCASATACKTACASDADCQGTADYCKSPGPSGTCVPKIADGRQCAANDQCQSGICGVNGTGNCCTAACPTGGVCGATACSSTGACLGPGPTTGCTGGKCSGTGLCVNYCGRSTSKCAFVSSALVDGNFGGLDGADALCQSLAMAAGLDGTFRAWLSDPTGSPSTRFTQAAVPYVRIDGVAIANNWAGLTSGTLLAPLDVTELGTPPPFVDAWSNTKTDGTQYTSNSYCNLWSSNSISDFGAEGVTNVTSASWTQAPMTRTCNSKIPFYCFEQ